MRLGLALALLVLVVGFLVALPEVVRRVAVDRLATATGRAVQLADVDLNLFTGRLALKGFQLARRDSPDPALEFERVDVRVSLLPLLAQDLRLTELRVTSPAVHIVRLASGELDFADLLALILPADPDAPPATTTVTIERMAVHDARVLVRDDAVSPAREWRLESATLDSAWLSTRAGAPPGTATARATLNGTPLGLAAESVVLEPGVLSAHVTVEGFALDQVAPYVPATLPALPAGGRATAALAVRIERQGDSARVVVSGDARVDDLRLVRPGETEPFLAAARAAVTIRNAEPLLLAATLAAVEIDGLDLRAVRDAQGQIDLLAMVAAAGAGDAAGGAPAGPTPAIAIERVALDRGTVTLRDEAVAPVTTLALGDLAVVLTDVVWPGGTPLTLDVSMSLPGAGRLAVTGTATLEPPGAEIAMSMRGAALAPFQPYLPVVGRFAGTFNGESQSRVSYVDGTITAASRGRSSIERLEIGAPGETPPAVRVERIELDGVDFDWPKGARVATVTVTRPDVRVDRDAQGEMNLRRLFMPDSPPEGAAGTTVPPAGEGRDTAADAGGGPPEPPLPVAIGTIRVEEGDVRFTDRALQPAFTETLSRLAVRIDGLSSEPGRRAQLAVQAVVGGDAALEVKGEVGIFGDLFADLSGELRAFRLPRLSPYSDNLLSWIIQRGQLGARFAYRVEKDQLAGTNQIVVERLSVAPSRATDEVEKRVGLPLGLIVALVTDSKQGIRFDVPMSGTLQQWQAGLGDAIWAAVRNALVNVIAAPFRAIGKLVRRDDERIEGVAIAPANFSPGSSALEPAAERHLAAVADVLRGAPLLRLALMPVTTAADAETLRDQELTARLQKLQRERGLPDYAAAVALEFRTRFPDVTPLPKPEEQLARLLAREPVPEPRLAELADRRVAAVRERLTVTETIEAERLPVEPAAPPDPEGAGRVEFRIAVE